MKEIKGIKTYYYEYKDFIITIKETKEDYEAFLNCKTYGYVMGLFGVSKYQEASKEHISLNEFQDMVIAQLEEYIPIYWEDIEKLERD